MIGFIAADSFSRGDSI